MHRTSSQPNSPAVPDDSAGDTPIVRIESLSHEGRGVARVLGKTVFIEGALTGELVRLRYRRRRKTYDTAEALEILEPSPDRVAPRCRYFGVCGGCSLQHLRPEAQLPAKQQMLRDNLERIGKVSPADWLPPLTGPVWGYRRRARLGVYCAPQKGGVLVGFRERHRSLTVPLASCEVLDPAAAVLLPALRDVIAALSRPDRIPQVEVAVGEAALAVVFRHLTPLTPVDQARLREFGRAHGVQVYLQSGDSGTVQALGPDPAAPLGYRLPQQGLKFQFSPSDFIQVNAEVNRRMVEQALALLDPQPHEKILDLFCGLGNFSLPLARRAARVLGLELEPGLVERARANAERNAIAHAEFRCADLYRPHRHAPWGEERFDQWLLDPPRTGALEMVKRLPPAERGPRRVLYVSCHPGTLARDSAVLVHVKGYRLACAGVLDMFPQTSHVEAMALFEKPV